MMWLLTGAAALSGSTVGLIALNIAQNGPAQSLSLDALEGSPPTDTGHRPSGPFTPTDTAPIGLDDVLTLRTKADVVRAWRNGATPALPGADGLEVYDGALLRRGVLSPASSVITHALFGGGLGRWRGKAFSAGGGAGANRFGGTKKNRFGVTSSDARELERLIYEQMREQQALKDPLMRELKLETEASAAEAEAEGAEGAEGAEAAEAGPREGQEEEVQARRFQARIEASRLDGRPALVLDYSTGADGAADLLWGKVLGMRDELREVAPGVLVGLGSMRATGGVRNCAPFVLARADTD